MRIPGSDGNLQVMNITKGVVKIYGWGGGFGSFPKIACTRIYYFLSVECFHKKHEYSWRCWSLTTVWIFHAMPLKSGEVFQLKWQWFKYVDQSESHIIFYSFYLPLYLDSNISGFTYSASVNSYWPFITAQEYSHSRTPPINAQVQVGIGWSGKLINSHPKGTNTLRIIENIKVKRTWKPYLINLILMINH